MVALSKSSPLEQSRSFTRAAMLADYGGIRPVSMTRMATRIGYKSTAELEELLNGEPSPRVLAMACNYFSIPQPSIWTEPPVLTVVPDPEPSDIPAGFVRIKRGKSGPNGNEHTPAVLITSVMILAANAAAHRALGNPTMVSIMTNDAERKLLIVPAMQPGEDVYRLQNKTGRITATHAARAAIVWGWSIGKHYLATPAYGGLLMDGSALEDRGR